MPASHSPCLPALRSGTLRREGAAVRQQQSAATARCVSALATRLRAEASPAGAPPPGAAAGGAAAANGAGGEEAGDGSGQAGAHTPAAGQAAGAETLEASPTQAPAEGIQDGDGAGGDDMPAVVCVSSNAVPESDEVRQLTGKAAGAVPGLVLLDAWEAAGNVTPGFTWDNRNDWAARELAPDRRVDLILVGLPSRGGKGHVRKAELLGDDVVLKSSSIGSLPSAVWPSDHFAVIATLRY